MRIFLVLVFFPFSLFANFELQQAHKQAYEQIFRLRLGLAKDYLSKTNPENAFTIYLTTYTECIESLLSSDKKKYENFRKIEKESLKKIEKMTKNSPYFLFFQAEILVQGSFVRLYFEDQVEAAQDLKKALKLLKENEEKYPNFLPNKKTLGALRVLISAVPQQHRWLTNFLGFKDDKAEKGIDQILQVADSQDFFAFEANLFYALLNCYLLDKAPEASDFLEKKFKNLGREQQLYHFVAGLLAYKAQQPKQALWHLDKIVKSDYTADLPIVFYLKAECYLVTEKYEKSLINYNNFLTYYKGKHYIKDCFYKMFVAYYVLENQKYVVYYQLIPKRGSKTSVPDQYAQNFYEKKQFPNLQLLKARLLIDGGFSEKAYSFLDSLSEKNFTKKSEQLEYFYRKARAAHQAKKTEIAVELYKKTIAESANEKLYFAPNAALQLGYIFIETQPKLAQTYFEKVLAYPDHEYKNSLDSKAKIALKLLKK